ncbi:MULTISPECIES: DUF2164 domain-containing protein [unclassified Rhizobium]|uniref:DUF2164 domain-containing protein n=1 Tax=unclassified Rhizobium TaxID=2613769 RepID=UPI001AD99A44|nr:MULTISPECIES: DUF2164 domain-containing protein [unclassified Rhizobium]MBO9098860.1 DUF2164 domain-containing protein [Rhizobium sp. L58/93]MBO9132335.1 DUF2164 domain-containing protein [Rhizobium sp. B209b/85]MBO9169125.1 DUF2164 domain-containing protein [Rhizobium sp. L245/93]MBO9185076.1 DUF2164 domain-containing protein [Rhizobium sp. E27B/91]QXZ85224.1 DUF2164 domain-containing protein [Rhizobium sp. K1/93]
MKKIILPKEEKAAAVTRIREYFADELDQTIGVLPAEFLLEFFANDIGAFFYNQGLRDAHAALTKQMEDFGEAIYLLERERNDGT